MATYSIKLQMKLYVLVGMTGMIFGAELVASQVSKSFVLLADAYHTLYNLLSLLLLVIGYGTSKARTIKNTFGWARLEVLGILFNILVLCALYFALTLGAVLHLLHASHDPIRPLYPMLILTFGLIGLLANFICFLLIGGYTHHQDCYLNIEGSEVRLGYVVGNQPQRQSICETPLNRRERDTVARNELECQELQQVPSDGARAKVIPDSSYGRFFLRLLRDAFSCLLVVLSACAVFFLERPLGGALADYADPVLSIFGVILQTTTIYPFLKETGLILLQTVPNNIDIEKLKSQIRKEFPAIQNVHELHVWKQSKSQVIATVHIIVSSHSVYAEQSSRLQAFFQEQGISSATVQPEFRTEYSGNMPDLLTDCILPCTANCQEPNCCRPESSENGVRQRQGHSHGPKGHQHEHHDSSAKQTQKAASSKEDLELTGKYDYSNLTDCAETTL